MIIVSDPDLVWKKIRIRGTGTHLSRQRDLHRIQALLPKAKVFRRTVQNCTLSLIYLL